MKKFTEAIKGKWEAAVVDLKQEMEVIDGSSNNQKNTCTGTQILTCNLIGSN